ncbi:MAG: hypothetical protein R2758_05195 [Bacteroidales bacterium]
MSKTLILLGMASLLALSFRADKPAYNLYDSEGKKVKYQKMISRRSRAADVIFFGELHDNPIAHRAECMK